MLLERPCADFFFNDTATTEIYTLSLHDALPILLTLTDVTGTRYDDGIIQALKELAAHNRPFVDRKSTRLNSSHANISYAVFCLKKKKCLLPARASGSFTANPIHLHGASSVRHEL